MIIVLSFGFLNFQIQVIGNIVQWCAMIGYAIPLWHKEHRSRAMLIMFKQLTPMLYSATFMLLDNDPNQLWFCVSYLTISCFITLILKVWCTHHQEKSQGIKKNFLCFLVFWKDGMGSTLCIVNYESTLAVSLPLINWNSFGVSQESWEKSSKMVEQGSLGIVGTRSIHWVRKGIKTPVTESVHLGDPPPP